LNASRVPLITARNCLEVQKLAAELTETGNLNAISDAASAATLARAALTCAAYNVRINLNNLSGVEETQTLIAQLTEIESQSDQIDSSVKQTLGERGGLK
ncbi:MAG TPA: methenyltetrahydrofolate cyclohydrolase, partial [Anaerolineaceae bacterium]|nr:methenyltetrahydrofolate cyclohydrolase [Anaerolineaceae bacterium]